MACPYCKAPVVEGASKCSACGEWLDKSSARKAKGELHPAVKIVAVIVMLVLAYWFVMAAI